MLLIKPLPTDHRAQATVPDSQSVPNSSEGRCRPRPESRPAKQAFLFEPPHRFQIPFEVLDRVGMIVNLAILQKAIELEPGQAEQLGSLVMGQLFGAIAFNDKGFESLTSRVGMPCDV